MRRGAARILLALTLAASLAIACRAEENLLPSGPPPAASAQVPPISPGQAPAFGPDAPLSVTRLPPVAPLSPDLPPVTTPPIPVPGAKDAAAAPPGDPFGFGGRGGIMGIGDGMSPFNSLRYGIIWLPSVPVGGQAAQFQTVGQDLSFSRPLWTDAANVLSLSGGVRNRLTETDAILPDTGQPFPENLWNINFGLRYARQLGEGWVAGGGLSVGSASDHPFAGIREMNVGMNAMLRIPQGEHNAWLLSLMYSPTGELQFPVPGVAFNYNPSPQFQANIGLPLMMTWRPNDDWQFQASYMLIRTIHLKAVYRLRDRLSAFAAYDWSNEVYVLLDRPEENDRFYMYDQRLSLGLQSPFAGQWTASVSAGYVFDRFMFEGKSLFAGGVDRLTLGNGAFASLNLGVRF